MATRLIIWALFWLCFPALALTIKPDAPETYTVKKGDTLWDISAMFLEQPWYWPELWRNNREILNPHLIYPGDQLRLVKNAQGEVSLEVVRARPEKKKIKLTPAGRKVHKQMANAVPLLPWSVIQPYVEKDQIMDAEAYEQLPALLGNYKGNLRFAEREWVLTGSQDKAKRFAILRQQNTLKDMQGEVIGVQVRHVAEGERIPSPNDKNVLIEVQNSRFEARQGDRLAKDTPLIAEDLGLKGATSQRGFIIDSLQQHRLLGKYDVVVLDQGAEEVEPGTVMGIYIQGPDINPSTPPAYTEGVGSESVSLFEEPLQQPGIKVGELVVFKVFERASYALIVNASDIVRRGSIVAMP